VPGSDPVKPQTVIEQLLFSTVRIEADKPAGTEAGTSFIFSYEHDSKQYLFLVTNKHVVSGANAGRFFFTLSDGQNPRIGERFDIQMADFQNAWVGHPDSSIDIAAMPLVPVLEHIQQQGRQAFFKSIPHTLVPSDAQLSELDALEEVVFVGYPSGMFDAKNLMPILRRGTTATPPQLDYEGSKVFLVDASVFPGSSGSPVLICNQGSYGTKQGIVIGTRVLFLGVIAQVVIREEEGKIVIVTAPSSFTPIVRTRQMIDLGIVYKSMTVVETVQEVLRQRGISI
jgi:hypothetical protein